MTESQSHAMIAAVQHMYEAFPYPSYPLLGKPHWQDGYLTASKFAAKLFEDLLHKEAAINTARGQYVRNGRTVLVAGAGEILPYIVRKNEPSAHRMLCVDLSAKSLRRARWRLGLNLRPTQFIRSDINLFLRQQASVTGPYDHIDVYGVLHHLPEPQVTMDLLASHLSDNGTMRIMVYNSRARHWIHQIQKVFRTVGLNPFKKQDREIARTLLEDMAELSPYLAEKFRCLGNATIKNDARLIDTFFHVREARLSLRRWFEIFNASGLKPYALVDRYAELDDLPNPLWQVPSVEDLEKRAFNGDFENNLEIFLCKPRNQMPRTRNYSYERKPTKADLWYYYLKPAPHQWFGFHETKSVPFSQRYRLWTRHFNAAYKTGLKTIDDLNHLLPLSTLQRLARSGAIFPSQVADPQLRAKLAGPMHSESYERQHLDKANFAKSRIADRLADLMRQSGRFSERRLHIVLERLNRSQMRP